MIKNPLNSVQPQMLRWPAMLAAVVFAAIYFYTALPRVFYPYDLDFIEDGMLMASYRMANSQPVFMAPNAEFVPHVYMPLYSWLGGLLFTVTGPGFAPLRLLSLAAVIVIGGLIFWIARYETEQGWLGIVCAGLFLGGYRISGFWYELARVDTLFVALVLAGVTLLSVPRDPISNGRMTVAAGVLALSFFTKQTTLLFGVVATFYLLFTLGRRAWVFAATFGAWVGVPALLLNISSEGWFFFYTLKIAGINPIEVERVLNFVFFELLGLMAALSITAIGAGLLGVRQTGARVFSDQPWLAWIATAVVVSAVGRASVGGNLNNLMLAHSFLCLSPALLMRRWKLAPNLSPQWGVALISLLAIFQFALGAYNPLRYIPGFTLRHNGDQLIGQIAAIDGEVLVLMHPYYALLAGKTPSAQMAALWHARQRGTEPLPKDFSGRIEHQYYAAIISDESLFETETEFARLLSEYYYPAKTLEADESPTTTTGMIVRPKTIYRPK